MHVQISRSNHFLNTLWGFFIIHKRKPFLLLLELFYQKEYTQTDHSFNSPDLAPDDFCLFSVMRFAPKYPQG